MSETTDRLTCPGCGSADDLGTLEELTAVSTCRYFSMGDGYPTPTFTGETDYCGEMTTVGVCCACGWDSPNITDLVPA